MIIIWDNGGQYSDHAVYFIDSMGFSEEDVLALCKLKYTAHDYLYGDEPPSASHCIAIVETLEWRNKDSLCPAINLVVHHRSPIEILAILSENGKRIALVAIKQTFAANIARLKAQSELKKHEQVALDFFIDELAKVNAL